MVRVAIAVERGEGMDALTASRFGRAPAFVIVDISESGDVKYVKTLRNSALGYGGGVGVRVVKMMAEEGCEVVAGPAFGPNASAMLSSLGIRPTIIPPGISVRDAVKLIIDQLSGKAPPPAPYGAPPGRFGRHRHGHSHQVF